MEMVGGEVVGKKGPVFTTAIVAGVQAAKRTSDLIPFCHPLPIEDCRVELSLKEGGKVSRPRAPPPPVCVCVCTVCVLCVFACVRL